MKILNLPILSAVAFDKCEVSYHCSNNDFILKKIYSCTVYSNYSNNNTDFASLKMKFNSISRVYMNEFDFFYVISVGSTKHVEAIEQNIQKVQELLVTHYGILVFLDNDSLTFILQRGKENLLKVLIEFLNQELTIKTHLKGITISLNIPDNF